MKKLLLVIAIFASLAAEAQQNNGSIKNIISQVKDIREKLVDLALENPANAIADLNIQSATFELKKTKWEWLNTITIAGNLNEYSINPAYANSALLYPKYNFGLMVPLGFFGTKSNDVKIARDQLSIARATKENTYREIRSETLTKYEDYMMYKQFYTLQVQLTDDSNTSLTEAQKKFSNGEIPIEDYNDAAHLYNGELVKKISALHDLNVSKIALEKLIGTDLDTVLGGGGQ